VGRTSDAKTRLLATAMELMYTRGYTAVGVQELCAHAGVKKGSFYHFFPSKRELALAVIDTYGQSVRAMWERAMAADYPLYERMQRLFELAYHTHRTFMESQGHIHGCLLGNFALELSCQDEGIRQRLRQTFTDWVEALDRVLHEAVTNGDIPAIDTTMTAQTIVAYFEGVVLLAKTQNDPEVVKRLAQGAVHLIEAAIHTHRLLRG
jgi:TetR/AcrR family transcriptional repressor of nem operon